MRHRAPVLFTIIALCLGIFAVAGAQDGGRARPPSPARAEIEGQGALRAVSRTGQDLGPCPLRHTDVAIEVSGGITRARVTQTFENPFTDRIEAIYTFPLPEDAAVRDFEMRVGERLIRGQIQRREDARENYEAARRRGETASLLEQERPNIFIQSVANIEPGRSVQVTIEYVDVVEQRDGLYSVVFPMTVGPRFVSGTPTGATGGGFSPDTDEVPDGSRITPMPAIGTRAGHDISVSLSIDAGVPIQSVTSITHRIEQEAVGQVTRVRLAPSDRIPNKDLVVEYRVAPEAIASGVIATRPSSDPGTAMLVIHPMRTPAPADIRPRELIFVLDTSGSMGGEPIEKSMALMDGMLSRLRPNDAFNVMTFDDAVSTLSPDPMPATRDNIARGRAFVQTLGASGGTQMMNGIRAAMAMDHDPRRLKIVIFMTDGYVGADDSILAEISRTRGEARIFSLGIGASVNRFLLDGMAERSRGSVQYVLPGTDAAVAVASLQRRLDAPVLTDLRIDWGGLAVNDVSPATMPDLFAGEPLIAFARFTRGGQGTVRLRGRLGARPFEETLQVTLPEREAANQALEAVWARRQVDARMAVIEQQGETPELVEPIVALALRHRLMTKYTSFLAVETREEPVEGGPPRRVDVPVELPAGVDAEGIFGPAVSLSLARFQPGDPEIRIAAPPGAESVAVIFPFGETKAAQYEPGLDRWTARFLVPRGTPDGVYDILVLITQADGSLERWTTSYTVDSSAPTLDLLLDREPEVGRTVRITGTQQITQAELALIDSARTSTPRRGTRRARRVDVELVADAARVTVRTPDGQLLTMIQSSPGTFEASWTVHTPVTAASHFELVAVDGAGNRSTGSVMARVGQ